MDTYEGGALESVPPRHKIPHYHGDSVRILLVLAALTLLVAATVGAALPLSTTNAVICAALLVLAAGVTNPEQAWIHWVNLLLALGGTLLFGVSAVEHYRAGGSLADTSFAFIEALALLSLIALYFTTKTVRGKTLRREPGT